MYFKLMLRYDVEAALGQELPDDAEV